MKKKPIQIIIYSLIIISICILFINFFLKNTYKDDIGQTLKNKINSTTNLKTNYKNISLSIWEHFPYISINIDELLLFDSIQNTKNDTVIYSTKASVNFNIIDLLVKKNIIQQIYLDEGIINLNKNKHQFLNQKHKVEYPQKNSNIKELLLINIKFKFLDDKSKSNINCNINECLIDINEDIYDLKGKIFSKKVQIGKINYLEDITSSLNLKLKLNNNQISIVTGSHILIEEVLAEITGVIGRKRLLNLSVATEKQQIKHIIRYMPKKFRALTKSFLAEGLIDCKGEIIRKSDDKNPSFAMNFNINNGVFELKEKPIKFTNISTSGKITNGNLKNFQTSEIEFSNFSTNLANGKIFGNFKVNNLNKLFLTGDFNSSLEANDINNYFQNSPFLNLKGKINASSKYKGNISFDKKFSEYFLLAEHTSKLEINNMNFNYLNSPIDYSIDFAEITMNNENIIVDSSSLEIENSMLNYKGHIKNLVAYFTEKSETINLFGEIKSDKIIYSPSQEANNRSVENHLIPKWITFDFDVKLKKLIYNDFYVTDLIGKLRLQNRMISGENINGNSLGGNITSDFSLNEETKNYLILKANLILNSINIQNTFVAFNDFNQNFIQSDHIKGISSAKIDFESHWKPDTKFIDEKLILTSDLTIEKGELINFEPLEKLSSFVSVDDLKHVQFSTLKNTIDVKDKIVTIPKMEINSSALSLLLSGTHTFDNLINYDITLLLSELLFKKFKTKNNSSEFGEVVKDDQNFTAIFLKMSGDKDKTEIAFDGLKLKEDIQNKITKEVKFINTIIKEDILNPKKKGDNDKLKENDIEIEWDEEEYKP
tara:strand:- start:1814 stop:4294 length:2481 start_codon:yes stop_codon:yes gene_type:complete